MQYVCFDTETTGLSPKTEKIIEIAAVKVEHTTGKIIEEFPKRINPVIYNDDGTKTIKKIGSGAYSVHHISNKDIEQCDDFAKVAPRFIEFISDLPIIAHNARFDIGFIISELNRLEEKSMLSSFRKAIVLDTLKYSRNTYGYNNSKGNSLDSLASRYDIDISDRDIHGALLDSRILSEVVNSIPDKCNIPTKYAIDYIKDISFLKS